MADPVAAYVEAHELGEIERVVPLAEKLALGEGRGEAPAVLCQTDKGVWLVAATDSQVGIDIDLFEGAALHYRPGKLRDTLEVAEQTVAIPFASGADAQVAIGVGRLRPQARVTLDEVPTLPRYVDSPTPVERAWIESALEPDSVLLAWLVGTNMVTVPSPVLDDPVARLALLVTDRRCCLVAVSPVGDAIELDLPSKALKVNGRRGNHTVITAKGQLSTTRSAAGLFREIAQLPARSGDDRVFEACRLAWENGNARHREAVPSLLELLIVRDYGPAHAAASLVGEDQSAIAHDLGVLGRALADHQPPADTLVALWEGWGGSLAAGQQLVERLRGQGTLVEPWAITLHEHLHQATPARTRRDEAAAARDDIALAQHLIVAGSRERARELLEARLTQLPNERRADLLPPLDADLTAGDGGQALRTRVFELLVDTRGDEGQKDPAALTELVRLHPLVVNRLRELESIAPSDLADRVHDVILALEPGGLSASVVPPAAFRGPRSALTETLVDEVLRHPLSREEGPPLDRIRAFLAAVPVPEYGMLRDYCERLSDRTSADARHVFEDSARVLGVPAAEGYVSRGTKGVGVRAYDGQPPFVLIGGDHLESNNDYQMTTAELHFAIGAEVAHLRFGHTRVTSSDAWNGAVAKAKQGLDVALGVLPFRGALVADRLARAGSALLGSAVTDLIQSTGTKRARTGEDSNASVLSIINEELLVTHRVMQLTADRAGLLVSGDLRSAIRAMLLVRQDFREELSRVERKGLAQVLGQRSDDGHMAYQDLAIRIAALLRFYLSPDYMRLRTSLDD